MKMKRIIKVIIILLCAFAFNNVMATEIEVDNIEIYDKSNYVTENNEPELDSFDINYDLRFEDFEQYIIYKITLSNTSDNDFNYDLNFDNTQMNYTIINDDNNYIQANSTKNIFVKINYQEEIDESLYEEELYNTYENLQLVFTAPKVKGAVIDLIENPKTGVFFNFGLVVVLIIVGTIIYIKTKRISIFKYYLIAFLLIIPTFITAGTARKIIYNLNLNIDIRKPNVAIFEYGIYVNGKMDELTGGNRSLIKYVKRSLEKNDDSILISCQESDLPIYMWYDNQDQTIYYYSDAKRILYNSSSSNFYRNLRGLISIDDIKSDRIELAKYMFGDTSYNVENIDFDFSNWNLQNLRQADGMFSYFGAEATNIKINLDNWEFHNAEYLGRMFDNFGYRATNIDCSANNWKILNKNVYNNPIFYGFGNNATNINFDAKDWYIEDTYGFTGLFQQMGYYSKGESNIDISGWTADNTSSFASMFNNAFYGNYGSSVGKVTINATGWDIPNTYSISGFFNNLGYYYEEVNVIVDDWNTPKLESVQNFMSSLGYNAKIIDVSGLNTWSVPNLKYMDSAFNQFGYNATQSDIVIDISNWQSENIISASYLFNSTGYNAKSVYIDSSNKDFSKAESSSQIYYTIGYNSKSVELIIDDNVAPKTTNTSQSNYFIGMLAEYDSVDYLKISAKNLDLTGRSSRAISVVRGGKELTEIDFSGWKIDSSTYLNELFTRLGKGKIVKIDMSNWELNDATNLTRLFYYLGYQSDSFELDLSGWDTSNVTSMNGLFYDTGYYYYTNSQSATIDIEGLNDWDISNVTDLSYMFNEAFYNRQEIELDLSNWTASSATNLYNFMYDLGYNAKKVNINLGEFDISNATNSRYAFSYICTSGSCENFDFVAKNMVFNSDVTSTFNFGGGNSVSNIDISGLDLSGSIVSYQIFGNMYGKKLNLNVSNMKLHPGTSYSDLKRIITNYRYSSASDAEININLSNLNINELSNITNLDNLFYYSDSYDNLTDFIGKMIINFTGWDVSRITSMSGMFNNYAINASERNFVGTENWNI